MPLLTRNDPIILLQLPTFGSHIIGIPCGVTSTTGKCTNIVFHPERLHSIHVTTDLLVAGDGLVLMQLKPHHITSSFIASINRNSGGKLGVYTSNLKLKG